MPAALWEFAGKRLFLVGLAALAAAAACLLDSTANRASTGLAGLLTAVSVISASKWVSFELFRLPAVRWRAFGLPDALAVTWANTSGTLLAAVAWGHFDSVAFTGTLLWLDWLHCQFFVSGLPLAMRLWAGKQRRQSQRAGRKPILIYGAGRTGTRCLASIQTGRTPGYQVVGFIDDDPAQLHTSVRMTPVLGLGDDVPRLVRLHAITEILIAIRGLDRAAKDRIRMLADLSGAPARFVSSWREAKVAEEKNMTASELETAMLEQAPSQEERTQESILRLILALETEPSAQPAESRKQAQR